MRTKYKPKAVEYLNTHFENQFKIDDEIFKEALKEFVLSKETYLEIGPGKGQFIFKLQWTIEFIG